MGVVKVCLHFLHLISSDKLWTPHSNKVYREFISSLDLLVQKKQPIEPVNRPAASLVSLLTGVNLVMTITPEVCKVLKMNHL